MKTRQVGDTPLPRIGEPVITYGNWSATSELKWVGKVLMQKFKRRVKRDWGRACWNRTMEYEWKAVPVEK
jgi:hypothetical protein